MQALIIPFIIVAGAANAFAAVTGAQLRVALGNVWLASSVVFAINLFLFAAIFMVRPLPLPTLEGLAAMPWWAPLSGLLGALAGFAGIMFIDKVGASVLNGLLQSANILASLGIDHFGLFGAPVHPMNLGRAAGAALLVAGIVLIQKF